MSIRIHCNDPLDAKAMERLNAIEGAVVTAEAYDKETLISKMEDVEVIIVRSATKVTKEVIEAGKNLKIIARAGAGLDNVDCVTAKEKGIKVINTPGANSISVAELAIGLMLSFLRHIPRGTAGLKEGKWEKKQLKGHELYKSTVGVVGFGSIGKEVAKRLLAFGCKVLAYDVVQDKGGLDIEFVSLDELFSNSDIITLHVPLIEPTKNLINADSIAKMKDGVILIDAARGGIVNEQAVCDGLESGKIAGAAFDVFGVEPPVDELRKKLLSFDNVIGTPHIGATTVEAQKRVGQQIIENLIKAL